MRARFLLTVLGGALAYLAFIGAASAQCTNTCSTAFDNECDDGGPGSLYAICPLGSDCNDCGPRGGGAPAPTPTPGGGGYAGCTNTCSTSFDNECDDGGPGSLYAICPLGTDCNDCGPRGGGAPAPPPRPTPTPGGAGSAGCTNTCATSFDNECDDGGPGSLYAICPLGTDCNDCGPRGGGATAPTPTPPPPPTPAQPTLVGGTPLPPPNQLVPGPHLTAQFCAAAPHPDCGPEIQLRDLNRDGANEIIAHDRYTSDIRVLTWRGAGWVDVFVWEGMGINSHYTIWDGANLGWQDLSIHTDDAGCVTTTSFVWNGSNYVETASTETGNCD